MPLVTPEEFLERERAADAKHEYRHGQVFAMAEGSPPHSFVINNIQVALATLLRDRPCYVFNADLRVSVRWGKLITYPDVTVICEKPQYVDERRDTLTNPSLIVEVLSPSTRQLDLGDKAFLYREAPSMREILLVDPEPVMVEHYWRLPNGHWEVETVEDRTASIRLASLDCGLAVSEIYRNVELL